MYSSKKFLSAFLFLSLSGATWSANNISIQPFAEYETNTKGEFSAGENGGSLELEDGVGFGGNIALNDFMGNENLRLEGTLRYRSSNIENFKYDKVDGSREPEMVDSINNALTLGGEIDQVSAEAGLWRDIDLGGKLTPYVGGAIQYTRVNIDSQSVLKLEGPNNEPLFVEVVSEEGDGGGFGLVLGAGVNYQAYDNVAVGVDYNYRRSKLNIEFDGVGNEVGDEDLTFDSLSSHAIMVGATVSF